MDRACTSQGDPHSAPDVPSFNRQSDDSIQRLSNPLPTAWVSSQPRPTSACHSVELLRRGDFRYLVSGLSIPFDKEPIQLEECLRTSTTNGLTDAEARVRLASCGQNVMKRQRRYTGWTVLWKQVANAMTAILVGCLIIAFATRDYPEGGVIAAFIAANIGIGFFHEYRAERAMDSLKKLSSPTATVLRNRTTDVSVVSIATSDVTVGDVVELQIGQVVPADLRLFWTFDLQIDESLLTGESLAVLKGTEVLLKDRGETPSIGECSNIAFAGTVVSNGRGRGIVYATGMNTEMSKMAKALSGNRTSSHGSSRNRAWAVAKKALGLYNLSPLQLKLAKLAYFLLITSVVLVLIVFSISRFKITSDVALYAIALALAIIPESLTAVVAMTMAKGVTHMARRNAIVRSLDSMEALGGIGDICCDKTGTLTTGKMIVRKVWNGKGVWSCEGSFDDPEKFGDLIRCASLSNNAAVTRERDNWHAHGEAIEVALQLFAAKSGFLKSSAVASLEDLQSLKSGVRYTHVQTLQFNSDTKRMTVVFHDLHTGKNESFMKGAPERVLEACIYDSDQKILTEDKRMEVFGFIEQFASEGLKVLAFAFKTVNSERDDIESGMTMLGLIGVSDPPRHESLASVRSCQCAGINVHMLTGDHITTATAIAREVGIITSSTDSVVNAQQLDNMTEADFDSLPALPLVVARCSPQTKVQMVNAIRRRRRLVAMIGDGVNDSLALQSADVGIAMGVAGSEVARQAADIVLADDKFSTIVGAIKDGRRLFENQVKLILFLMSSNCAEVVVLVAGLAFLDKSGRPVYPLSPVQILWENLITSAFPAFALGLEPANSDIMDVPPKDIVSGVFSKEFAADILAYGLILGTPPLLSFVIIVYAIGDGNLGDDCDNGADDSCDIVYKARGTVFVSLTVLILIHAFEMKDFRKSIFRMNLLRNKPLLISVVGGCLALLPTIYIPRLNVDVFRISDISWEWGFCAAGIIFYVVGAECYKALKRRYWKASRLES